MLQNSFQHIPGVGRRTEKLLWEMGLTHWQSVTPHNPSKLSPKKHAVMSAHIEASLKHLANNNPGYFADLLPVQEHWRFFPEFRTSTAFIDIETTGMSMWEMEITTIALYDGKTVRYYIQGQNLDQFLDDIQDYTVMVTYNGKCFDVPFMERYFRTKLTHAHIDLRYVLRRLGYTGGLKRCEKALGLDRGDLDGVDGYFAVLLWGDYQETHNEKALETLLAYNIEDVLKLEELMVLAYNLNLQDTPFHETHTLPQPMLPAPPFRPHGETIRRIRRKMFSTGAFPPW